MTRKEYIDTPYENQAAAHRQYYAQFVTESIRQSVLRRFGREALLASNDPHLNDIPLARWDALANALSPYEQPDYPEGKRFWSLGSAVCILKEAARQLIESGC